MERCHGLRQGVGDELREQRLPSTGYGCISWNGVRIGMELSTRQGQSVLHNANTSSGTPMFTVGCLLYSYDIDLLNTYLLYAQYSLRFKSIRMILSVHFF